MNEIDLIGAVFLSSGAGYLLGKHYERKRASKAFRNFQQVAMQTTMGSIQAIMDVLAKRCPDVPAAEIMKDVVNAGRLRGVELVAMNKTDPNDVITPDVNPPK